MQRSWWSSGQAEPQRHRPVSCSSTARCGAGGRRSAVPVCPSVPNTIVGHRALTTNHQQYDDDYLLSGQCFAARSSLQPFVDLSPSIQSVCRISLLVHLRYATRQSIGLRCLHWLIRHSLSVKSALRLRVEALSIVGFGA